MLGEMEIEMRKPEEELGSMEMETMEGTKNNEKKSDVGVVLEYEKKEDEDSACAQSVTDMEPTEEPTEDDSVKDQQPEEEEEAVVVVEREDGVTVDEEPTPAPDNGSSTLDLVRVEIVPTPIEDDDEEEGKEDGSVHTSSSSRSSRSSAHSENFDVEVQLCPAAAKPDPDGAKQDQDDVIASIMTLKEREELLKAAATATANATAQATPALTEISMSVKEREAMLKADATKNIKPPNLTPQPSTGTKGSIVKEREQMLLAATRTATKEATTSTTSIGKGSIIKEREAMLQEAARKSSTASLRANENDSAAAAAIGIKEREAMLKAAVAKKNNQGRRNSDTFLDTQLKSNYNNNHDANNFQGGVKNQIHAINQRAASTKPPIHDTSLPTPAAIDAANRKRRASTGDILQKYNHHNKNSTTSNLPPGTTPARPTGNSKALLKSYNPDLYFTNELNILIDVDPATASSTGKQIDFDQVLRIVKECASVCRAKYLLTFDGQKRNLYPLFSLVANRAPLEVVKTVFFANPFRFLDVRDDTGWTLLHYACAYNPLPLESLEFLEKRNSHTLIAWDNQHRAPLHTACATWNPEKTEHVLFILNHSPPEIVATPDRDGKLPLDLAVHNKSCSSVLIKSLKEKAKGATPFSHDNNDNNIKPRVSTDNPNLPASEDPSPLHYKTTTETVGPQTWWEKLCCVPRV